MEAEEREKVIRHNNVAIRGLPCMTCAKCIDLRRQRLWMWKEFDEEIE